MQCRKPEGIVYRRQKKTALGAGDSRSKLLKAGRFFSIKLFISVTYESFVAPVLKHEVIRLHNFALC